ncbi:N-6 DNA methylase [Streptomyces sp. TP-A0874]|uniref:N-6 DNA methylase n=1 Tax=Streptomyces sp. TP-A0874 TaxID=549819 RepID=UPI0008538AFE|nr:N-6 DNA methylase [Streptomyces sp. TP-A0874]
MSQQLPASAPRVTAAEISRIAGVTRATVSNWRRRHEDFPSPDGGTESSPLYDLRSVQAWLRKRGQRVAASPAEELRTALRLRPTGTARLLPLVLVAARWEPQALADDPSLPDGELLERVRKAVSRLPVAVLHAETLPAQQNGPSDSGGSSEPRGRYEPADTDTIRVLARCVQDAGAQTALDLLAEHELEESGATGTYRTPEELAALMAILLPADTRTVLDPACGSGTLLSAAAGRGAHELYGQDVLRVQAQRTAIRLCLADVAPGSDDSSSAPAGTPMDAKAQAPEGVPRIETGDSLRSDAFGDLTVDAVLCNPPFGDRDWGHDELAYDPRWAHGVPPRSESELAWVQHALAHAAPGGHVVMLLPPAVASRASGRRIRAELARSGALRAVVALPAGAAHPLHLALHVWVLQRPKPGGSGRPSVLFVNGDGGRSTAVGDSPPRAVSYGTRGGTSRADNQPPVDWADVTGRVVGAWSAFQTEPDAFRDEPGVARAVPVVELLDDVVDLTPARHVRVTPSDIAPEDLARRVTELRGRMADKVAALASAAARQRQPAGGAAAVPWRTATIADLARGGALTLLRGAVPVARDSAGSSQDSPTDGSEADTRPVLTAADVSTGRPPSGTSGHIGSETGHVVAAGDVIIRGGASHGAPDSAMARVAGGEDAGALLGPHLHVLRPDPARLDPWFLAGFAGAEDNIAAASTGTTVVHVNPGRLRVPLLPLVQQQRYGAAFRRIHELRVAARDATEAAEETAALLLAGLTSGGLEPPADAPPEAAG